jgi:O-antigen ligase
MTRVEAERSPAHVLRWTAACTVALCILVGALAALNFHIAVLLTAGLVILGGGLLLVGPAGLVLLLPVFCCFAMLTRFDEAYAIDLTDRFRIPTIYWLAVASVASLLLAIPWQPRRPRVASAGLLNSLTLSFVLFGCAAVLSIAYNALSQDAIEHRSVLGEFLALGAILIPMSLAVIIPRVNLSRSQTVMCLRTMTALGAGTGIIMAVFGLFPDRVIAYLGWSQAAFGTLDLARGRTPLGHPNVVAGVLQLFMVISIVMGARRESLLTKGFYFVSAAALFIGILFALSRAALVVAGVMVLLAFAYLFLTRTRARKFGIIPVAGIMLAFAGTAAFLFSQYDFSRYWSKRYMEEASLEGRTESMRTAWFVWQDHWLWGTAPAALYPRIETEPAWQPVGITNVSEVITYRDRFSAPHPHNMYLLMLAEFGVIGAALLALFLLGIGWTFYRLRAVSGSHASDREVVAAIGLGYVAMLLSGMGESLFFVNIRHGIILWTLVGLAFRHATALAQETEI